MFMIESAHIALPQTLETEDVYFVADCINIADEETLYASAQNQWVCLYQNPNNSTVRIKNRMMCLSTYKESLASASK